jgi:hypothetical protein
MSLMVIVLGTIKGVTVMDVITNIPVLSVMGIIEDSNVIFVPKVIFAHSNSIPKCPQLPVSPLPTPIRYDRFAFFLDGYPLDKFNYLMSGFKFGFSLHFEGLKSPLRLIIYHHALSIQMLLTKN